MIKVVEMVQAMRLLDARGKSKPFNLVVVTADRGRGTGGRILELTKVILLTKKRQSDRYLLVQHIGSRDAIRIHLDLILYFNNQEVV